MSFTRNTSIDTTVVNNTMVSTAVNTKADYLYAWEAHPHNRGVENNLYLFYTKTLDINSSTPIYDATGTNLGTIYDIRSSNFPIDEIVELNAAKITLRFSTTG